MSGRSWETPLALLLPGQIRYDPGDGETRSQVLRMENPGTCGHSIFLFGFPPDLLVDLSRPIVAWASC